MISLMRRFLFMYFVTLVLLLSQSGLAAPVTHIPPDPIKANETNQSDKNIQHDLSKKDSTQVTNAGPAIEGINPHAFYPTRRLAFEARSVQLGLWLGPLMEIDKYRSSFFAAMNYHKYHEFNKGQDLGMEVTQEGYMGFNGGYRWLWDVGSEHEFYHKIGFGSLYDPKESLASLINWKRYNLRAGVGSENFMNLDRSMRAELSILLSPVGFSFQLSGSYAF